MRFNGVIPKSADGLLPFRQEPRGRDHQTQKTHLKMQVTQAQGLQTVQIQLSALDSHHRCGQTHARYNYALFRMRKQECQKIIANRRQFPQLVYQRHHFQRIAVSLLG